MAHAKKARAIGFNHVAPRATRRGRHLVRAQSVAVADCGPVRNAAELRPLDSAAYHVRDRLTVARPFRVSSQTPRGESLRKRPSAISWLRIEQIKFHHRG
jgi:hypothetical protein